MALDKIFDTIKSDFCNLTKYKNRSEDVIEVITPYSTLNGKFVSVFVRTYNDKTVVTDGGWVDDNYYDLPYFEESEAIVDRILNHYQVTYKVKTTVDKLGLTYYYKSCTRIEEVSSMIFDVSNFLVGVINASCIQYKDEKEEKERVSFKKDANDFLKAAYQKDVQFMRPLDDFKRVKFNAIITKGADIHLVTYITGSTPHYFDNDLRKTIVNFQVAGRSRNRPFIKNRISIINNEASGYNLDKSGSLIGLVKEATTQDLISWTDKEKILNIV